MIKPCCIHAPPPVHDVVRCLLFFSGGVAHPHPSLELYLLFIQRQKQVKITGTLLVETPESQIYWTNKLFSNFNFFYYFIIISFFKTRLNILD